MQTFTLTSSATRFMSSAQSTVGRQVTVTYELNPPVQFSFKELERTKTLSFAVPRSCGGAEYYEGLRTAIAQARDAVGDGLTAWRDAVGSLEQSKEPRAIQMAEEEKDEEDEEEAEE